MSLHGNMMPSDVDQHATCTHQVAVPVEVMRSVHDAERGPGDNAIHTVLA